MVCVCNAEKWITSLVYSFTIVLEFLFDSVSRYLYVCYYLFPSHTPWPKEEREEEEILFTFILSPFSFFRTWKDLHSPFSFGCLFLFLDPRLSSAISSLFCSSPLYFLDKTQIEYSLHFRYYGIEKAMVWKVMSSTRYRSISRKLYVLSHSGTSSSLWSLVYPGTFFFCAAI